ncbi:MAG: hypothetical protein HY288_09450 [Planctomycetia bacterium]|nr:hypothetical protein [Planctomycetia bacterium]
MLAVVLVVLLSVHLVLVDIAMTGPFVCVWLEWRETRHADEVAGRVGLRLARWANWALAGGIVVGCLLLAIRWWLDDQTYFSAVATIPRDRLWFALGELFFFFACMGAYQGLWQRWRQRRLAHRALAIAAASNLLLHFPALFAIISVLTTRTDLLNSSLDRSGYQRMLLDCEVLSRVAHVWLAGFAVSGMALMGLALRIERGDDRDPSRMRLIKGGALLALVPTLLQIPTGLWVAMEMPDTARDPLFGGDWLATGLFITSLLLTLQLMHSLAGIALGDRESRQIRNAIAVMMLVVLLMVGTRCRIHHSMLSMDRGSSPPSTAGRAAAKHHFHLVSGAAWVPIGAVHGRSLVVESK